MTPLIDLDRLAQLRPDELPAAIGELAAAQAKLLARLTAPSTGGSRVSANGAALNVAEVAQRTGMSTVWVYREARAGRLPFARRLGRRLLFEGAGLERWLASQR